MQNRLKRKSLILSLIFYNFYCSEIPMKFRRLTFARLIQHETMQWAYPVWSLLPAVRLAISCQKQQVNFGRQNRLFRECTRQLARGNSVEKVFKRKEVVVCRWCSTDDSCVQCTNTKWHDSVSQLLDHNMEVNRGGVRAWLAFPTGVSHFFPYFYLLLHLPYHHPDWRCSL